MHFTVIQIIIMFLIVYVCFYALVDRIVLQPEHTDDSKKPGLG